MSVTERIFGAPRRMPRAAAVDLDRLARDVAPAPPRPEPMASVLARASSPTDAQRALQEVITAMVGDAKRAGLEARAECDRLDDMLVKLQGDLFDLIEDFTERVRIIQVMYAQAREKALVAQRAIQAAAAAAAPAAEEERHVAADHEAPVDDAALTNLAKGGAQ